MPKRLAVIVGANGGIGSALVAALEVTPGFDHVVGLSRPSLDLADEASIARAAAGLPAGEVRLVITATGFLHGDAQQPEKGLRALDPAAMARSFALNATGPALVMKHFLPLLPRRGRSAIACLSARVGSIADNHLGGWYAYRASKAALNQLVHTAAIELARTHPEALCVALHPGTVATKLSAPFLRDDRMRLSPSQAAEHLLAVLSGLQPSDTGRFYDWRGEAVPW